MNAAAERSRSLWMAITAPPLGEDESADVAVVEGGIVGHL